eukprot:1160898-Pelagomonas_calceolata.AAC.6
MSQSRQLPALVVQRRAWQRTVLPAHKLLTPPHPTAIYKCLNLAILRPSSYNAEPGRDCIACTQAPQLFSPLCCLRTMQDLAGLYRLHITNTEHPPNFATLLQLQGMTELKWNCKLDVPFDGIGAYMSSKARPKVP